MINKKREVSTVRGKRISMEILFAFGALNEEAEPGL